MAASPRNWRDKVWLGWFIMQLLAIGLVDAVQYYPAWLYQPPGAPLHFLQRLRDYYVAAYDDPLVQEATAPGFMPFLFLVEVAFQLPVSLYCVWRLWGGRGGTSGSLELVLLVYAFETAFSTALCIDEILRWDVVWYQHAAWVAMPTLLFVDMYFRLYSRVAGDNAVKKNQ